LALVVDSGKVESQVVDIDSGKVAEEPPSRRKLWFKIAATGRTRPWVANEPLAFWRSLAELDPWTDPDYGERAAAFVRRFGPVIEPNSYDLVTNTRTWSGEVSLLAKIAKAWEPEGPDGLSRLSANRALRDDAVSFLTRFILPATMPKAEIAFDYDLRLQLHARSLYAFMALSAASMLRRQALMRRCGHCRIWFEPPRSDALYCSNACRGAHHIARHATPTRAPARKTPTRASARKRKSARG
jgi:hypothetical protein